MAEPEREVVACDNISVVDVVQISEKGIVLQNLSEIEKRLDGINNPATALRDIFTRVDLAIQNDESLQEWVSELVEKVAANQQWLNDGETDLNEWREMFPTIVESAKRGKSIRNKRREDIDALVAMGVGGPRFEHLIKISSRNFLHSVRTQIHQHGFSYPLVCCLGNIRTYHRLIGNTRGVQKTRQTQPVDLLKLDTVAYRELSEKELLAARIVIGPAGFITPSETPSSEVVVDGVFDKAVASFEPGLRGAQQPAEHAKAEPKIEAVELAQQYTDSASTAKPKKFMVQHNAFPFSQTCACAEAVSDDLKSALDGLDLADSFDPKSDIAMELLARVDVLCTRHCQLALVTGLGSAELRDKTNPIVLRKQLAEDLKGLCAYIIAKPTAKREFDAYKAALGGFSWSKLAAFTKANKRTGLKRKGAD